MGLVIPSFSHFSWPPLPFVPLEVLEQPLSNRNFLNSVSGIFDILTVFIQSEALNIYGNYPD